MVGATRPEQYNSTSSVLMLQHVTETVRQQPSHLWLTPSTLTLMSSYANMSQTTGIFIACTLLVGIYPSASRDAESTPHKYKHVPNKRRLLLPPPASVTGYDCGNHHSSLTAWSPQLTTFCCEDVCIHKPQTHQSKTGRLKINVIYIMITKHVEQWQYVLSVQHQCSTWLL